MKILKLGEENMGLWVGQCNKCEVVIELETKEIDIKEISPGDFRNDFESYFWRNCTQCQKGRICFHRKDSTSAKLLLEKENIK